MADDFELNPGTGGGSARAKQKGTPKTNVVILDHGGDGTEDLSPLSGKMVTVSTDVTRPADTSLYAIDDALSDSTTAPTTGGFTFSGAARASGKSGIILDLVVVSSNPAGTPLAAELFVFDDSVTAINDNAAFAVSDAEIKKLVARVPFTMQVCGNNSMAHVQNLAIGFTCVGSANLRFLVRVKNGYTPANAEVFTFRAKILQVD